VRGGAIIFLFSFNPQNGGKQKSKKAKKKRMFATFCGLQRNFQLIEPKKYLI
jgi:hypothetical protein